MKITNLGTVFLGTKKQEAVYNRELDQFALYKAIMSKYKSELPSQALIERLMK